MENLQTSVHFERKRAELAAYECAIQNPLTIGLVQEAVRHGTLTLVLGAGVSSGLGLPQWEPLIESIYRDVYSSIYPGGDLGFVGSAKKLYSSAVMVRHIESLIGFSSNAREILRRKLYENFDSSGYYHLIRPICEYFLARSLRNPVRHVISYNFDNVLELCMHDAGEHGVSTVYSSATYPIHKDGVTIFHPHGYIPHPDEPGEFDFDEPVVFSEVDYNLHYMDPSHWANVLQLHHFMNRSCLFIGTSLSDPNTRRLLDHARHRTGRLNRHISIQRLKSDKMLTAFIERDLKSLGVTPLWVEEYADIQKVLGICSRY